MAQFGSFATTQFILYHYQIGALGHTPVKNVRAITPYHYLLLLASTFVFEVVYVKLAIVVFYMIELDYLKDARVTSFKYHHHVCIMFILVSLGYRSPQKDKLRIVLFQLMCVLIIGTSIGYSTKQLPKKRSRSWYVAISVFFVVCHHYAVHYKDWLSVAFGYVLLDIYGKQIIPRVITKYKMSF